MPEGFISHLKQRQLIAQVNHEEELLALCETSPFDDKGNRMAVYIGFDPTAKSLHAGHLVQLQMLRTAQDFGFIPIILFGGATGMIGDPTDKTEMRSMHSPEQIADYVKNFEKLVRRYFRFDVANSPQFVNNIDWVGPMTWIQFAREVGVHFTVARLLAADVNRTRFESGGLTFMELGYQLLQAFDFVHLYKKFNCVMQIGGNDQWSNILAGADLIRRLEGGKAFALTTPLVTDSQGKKLGKTAGNAIWLDESMLAPYDFFQYFRNLEDQMMATVHNLYFGDEDPTFEKLLVNDVNSAKEHLAKRMTELVHGAEAAQQSLTAAKALFSGQGDLSHAPRVSVARQDIKTGMDVVTLLALTKITASKGEARRLVAQNGLTLNGIKILDPSYCLKIEDFETDKGALWVRKGKKHHYLVELS